ncbi:vitamin B12 transporter [Nonlabens dokdonensis]|uniref:TonB-dependent receptor n=2 Tax=Nonlabens dokdonensis TaxID=328515 RepID=L7W9K5_NONDD|nr:TonB-dependent receptor [Nonlabens dokdonensis]AGC78365.1 TonB-dependent receptor [Nonlabens dokdonensis DSW-6]PZX38117.1 vitamin B12 transporter [Nonlabens dokdonensis]
MKKQIIALSAMIAVTVSGKAQVVQDSTATKLEEVIVTASSKFDLQRKDSGKPVIKITRSDIEAQRSANIADLLNQYAGIEINGARSNAGQNQSYFVRGGSSRQVSILIDGAQVNDPSNISSEFDLRLIDIDQIEEIEILKGAASTLYGANASTAVINIKLRKAPKSGVRVNVASFIGTNKSAEQANNGLDEYNNSIQIQGTANNGLTYGLGLNHQSTNGLSAAESANENEQFEPDEFNRINILGRIGYNNNKDFKITSYLSFDENVAEFDNGAFVDGDNETYNRQVRWGTNMNWNYSEKGELVYTDVSTHTRRDTRSNFPSLFNADGYSLDLYNKYTFDLENDASLKTIVGFNFNNQTYEDFSIPFGSSEFVQNADKDDVNFQIYDPYFNVVYLSGKGFNVNVGARYNFHSNYDGKLVYNVNPSYRFNLGENVLKAYASYSTAYITPSLFQLYASGFGNEELEPEENATLEAGVYWSKKNSSLELTVFQRQEKNLVQFITIDPVNFISQYQNEDKDLTARGVEIMGQTLLFDKLNLTANYTFTERDSEPLLRRIPKHKVNASARIEAFQGAFFTLRYQYNHQRGDAFFDANTFTTQNVELDSYQLVDLDGTYKLKNKDVTFFAGISNVLNEDFQEIVGFQTRGRNYKVGVRLGL